jgi:hypothetical protein
VVKPPRASPRQPAPARASPRQDPRQDPRQPPKVRLSGRAEPFPISSFRS